MLPSGSRRSVRDVIPRAGILHTTRVCQSKIYPTRTDADAGDNCSAVRATCITTRNLGEIHEERTSQEKSCGPKTVCSLWSVRCIETASFCKGLSFPKSCQFKDPDPQLTRGVIAPRPTETHRPETNLILSFKNKEGGRSALPWRHGKGNDCCRIFFRLRLLLGYR